MSVERMVMLAFGVLLFLAVLWFMVQLLDGRGA